ncbi:ABC transporter permease [Nocardioides sp. IC4_145]|uniref:ABC transporter permease n=1 Tax=Nocardioides sp. IC4_145 TaxID=2714037 RepID=UPI001409CC80|nr:ABC transporter permease [Nocardioides sp. IC4_145]NHC24341.1 ABC transporter permease [Nocardioides sp. IC4_145]
MTAQSEPVTEQVTTGAVAGPVETPSTSRARTSSLKMGLLPVLLLGAVVLFAFMEPRFVSGDNGINIARQLSFLLLLAVAQMLVLLTAEIDMSLASNIALTSVVSATVMTKVGDGSTAILAGVLAGLATGLLMGLVNGLVTSVFNVPSFIVTIATASLGFGSALLLSDGSPISGLPEGFTTNLGYSSVGPVPVSFVIALVCVAVLYVVLYWTKLGRYIYSVGGSQSASRLLGVPVAQTKTVAFVLAGGLAAVAGLLLTARVASGEPNLGSEYLIMSIAAAVLGGTSFFGGEGRLGFVAIGALFLVVLSNGMNLIRVSSYTQEIVIGLLLILAVVLDRWQARNAR